jgi:transcriptional regulator with XRE-family HTH domain
MYKEYCALRDAKNLTDYRVSEDTGITRSTFTDWKTGRSKPGIRKLKTLADYFCVTVDYFLGGTNGEEKEKKENEKAVKENSCP